MEELELGNSLEDFYASLSNASNHLDSSNDEELKSQQSTELEKWGVIDVIGQHAEPICTYYMQSQVAAINILRLGLWEYP